MQKDDGIDGLYASNLIKKTPKKIATNLTMKKLSM